MKRWVVISMVAGALAAHAQQPSNEEEIPVDAADQAADPCAEFDPELVQGVLAGEPGTAVREPASTEEGEPARPPLSAACLEHLQAQRLAEGAQRGAEGEKTDAKAEDSQPSDEDFDPDEEISEDYPVPLPSDI